MVLVAQGVSYDGRKDDRSSGFGDGSFSGRGIQWRASLVVPNGVGSNCWLWMQWVPKMYDSDEAVNSFPPDRCAGGPFYALPP